MGDIRQWYRCLVIMVSVGYLECSCYTEPLMATKDGDIIIGGLFPVHESVNFTDGKDGEPSERNCTRYSVARLLQALMLVEAVESINRSPLLGNLTLGYRIVDSCSDVTTAVAVTQRYLDVNSVCSQEARERDRWNISSHTGPSRPVNVVIGGYHSEISIAVARQLSINQIPQISFGSTTGILSDKSRFPAFMRTVPEDNYQAQAIVDILVGHGWTWVGLVTTDGDYGRYAAQRFRQHAEKQGICVTFSVVLPDILDDTELEDGIRSTIKFLEDNPKARAVVSFAKADHMMYIMQKLTPNATGRVWIASDNWATSQRVLQNADLTDVGVVVGVTLKSAKTAHMEKYLEGLDSDPDAHRNNTMLQWFLLEEGKGRGMAQPELGETLKKSIYPYAAFSVGLAVRAIANAVADLCANRDCTGGKNFKPWELKHALRKATFGIDGNTYSFDKRGDLNSGYDLVLWRKNKDGVGVDVHDIVAKYNITSRKLYFVENGQQKVFSLTGNVTSRCSDDCAWGYRKVVNRDRPVCCFECTKCSNNTYSNESSVEECIKCGVNQWSEEGSTMCLDKIVVFFSWREDFAIVLLWFAALGVVITLMVLVLFLARWSTPVVKASVGPFSLLLLLSLLGTFTSTVLFVGRPNDLQCQARQVLFGISFTLCVSCILVKSLKILLAFQIDTSIKQVLDRLYQPYLIIAACVAVQVVICSVWLILSPPHAIEEPYGPGLILLRCDEGYFLYFGLMLAYNALLGLIGFVIAFMGRKLPNCYNDAKFISFSMVIYLICWVVFGPVYAQARAGVFLPAVEMIVILISAYAILCCHFIPKCYVICFKSKSNTREVFRRKIWEFVHRSTRKKSCDSKAQSTSSDAPPYKHSFSSDSFGGSSLNSSLNGSFRSSLSSSSSEPSLGPKDEKSYQGRTSPESGVFVLPLTPGFLTPEPKSFPAIDEDKGGQDGHDSKS